MINRSFGPAPWQQTNWDARAAGNFIGGGMGAGLVAFTLLSGADGMARAALLLGALTLVGLGLLCVWFEIGRPLRAINVFLHPRRSWMSREAMVAPLLMAAVLTVAAGWSWMAPVAGLLSLAYVYCQARIVQAAKGIPAWREPMTVPLLVSTGLAEGAGVFWLVSPWTGQAGTPLWLLFGALVAVRFVVGVAWYRRLSMTLQPLPLAAVNRAGHAYNAGSLLAMALVLGVWASPVDAAWVQPLQAFAGLLAAVGGAVFKLMLVTRAAGNQGFALPQLPVRGAHR